MTPYIKLLRPHQYLKNLAIFLPLFFAGQIRNYDVLLDTGLIFIGFCLCASAIYILNDTFDIEDDRKHPTKKNRPLASGAVPVSHGIVIMLAILAIGSLLIFFVNKTAFFLTAIYVGNNLLYSFRLKHIPILDINIIAVGFVLRLFIGESVAPDLVPLTMWIVLITFLLALFLALAKRRDDVLLAATGKKVRKSIDGYNLEFINGGMIIMASVTIVSYISYTISEEVINRVGSDDLYLTTIFVLLGVLRYLQITFVEKKSGSPTKVLMKDIFLQLTLVAWLIAFVAILYL